MKIGFNLFDCGLANNGGSRTLIKCAEVLNQLGHRCTITSVKDEFTWFEHEKPITYIPNDLDWVIASNCHSVRSTFQARCPNKAWYIRAHEDWSMPEPGLRMLYKSPIVKIANSNGLKRRIERVGCSGDVHVVYQGLDIGWWRDYTKRTYDNKIVIGCLYTGQKRKRWRDFVKLQKILGREKYTYVGFGPKSPPKETVDDFIVSPSVPRLNMLYNRCHFWFAPTDNEGLHNPPMEAALCGCVLVCSNFDDNGMIHDYAYFDDHRTDTALVYDGVEKAAFMIENFTYGSHYLSDVRDNAKNTVINKIGSREQNMKKMVKLLEAISNA